MLRNHGGAGERELALQQFQNGLHAPNASVMLSYGALKLHLWDPLRGDPRFEKIVADLARRSLVAPIDTNRPPAVR